MNQSERPGIVEGSTRRGFLQGALVAGAGLLTGGEVRAAMPTTAPVLPTTLPALQGLEKIEPAQQPVPFALRAGHPRVLVGPEHLEGLRRRAATTHRAEFETLIQLAQRQADRPGRDPQSLWRLAFLYLLTGERSHADIAREMLKNVLTVAVNGRYGRAAQYMLGLGCAYDWLHDALDEQMKQQVAARALLWCQAVYDSKEVDEREYFYGHYFNQIPYILMCGLAIGEEHQPERTLGFVQNAVWRLQRTIPGFRHFLTSASFPMSYSYTVTYMEEVPYLFQCSDVALGTRLFEENRWIAHVIPWWTYALRDDETFVRFGDYFGGRTLFGNPAYFRVFATIASTYRDPLAQWWVNRFRPAANEPDRIIFEERENAPEPQDPEVLPRRRFFDRMGVAVARGNFSRGTVAAFKCSPVYLHNHCHRDANSFTLYHKGDQALDAGAYDSYETPHWYNYYVRTIAHNTLVVHDPQEKMVSRGTEYANDGGQRFVNEPHWQPRSYEEIFDPAFREGQVLAYREGRDFSYVCGDATNCYSPGKLTEFLRHVVFVQDWPSPGCVSLVVLDEVELAQDGLVPRILLHTQGQPEMAGKVMVSKNKGGRLTTSVLWPPSAQIELVGGEGKEFWVDGRNYPPHEGPGSIHTLGAWRAEISPGDGARRVRFVTLLVPADVDAPAEPGAALEQTNQGWIVRQGELTVQLVHGELKPQAGPGRNVLVKLARRDTA